MFLQSPFFSKAFLRCFINSTLESKCLNENSFLRKQHPFDLSWLPFICQEDLHCSSCPSLNLDAGFHVFLLQPYLISQYITFVFIISDSYIMLTIFSLDSLPSVISFLQIILKPSYKLVFLLFNNCRTLNPFLLLLKDSQLKHEK